MKRNLSFMEIAKIFPLFFIFWAGQAESLDIKTIIQGTVQEIESSSVKISRGINGDKVLIATNANTVYDNAQKLTDLQVGDKIQIEYQEGQKKIVANSIMKIETGFGDNF